MTDAPSNREMALVWALLVAASASIWLLPLLTR
jgi:hypothetical protein